MPTYEQIIRLIEDGTTIDHNHDMVVSDWDELQQKLYDLFHPDSEEA